MSGSRLWFGGALVGALVGIGTGCGGDDLVCGEGTVQVDGECVVDNPVECAAGTTLMDGQCVPDGSVICEQGTVYDPDSGKCVLDPSACAAGTVLVDGECVPFDDTLVGDITEPAEPNDFEGGTPGSFTLPAIGASAVTISGCIEPDDFDGDGVTEPDTDGFTFEAAGPTLLSITIDGRGGASAAFLVGSADPALGRDGWHRVGADLTSDGASRQVYLPKGATFGLAVTDARSLFLGLPAGSPDACYFLQIEQIAIPTPADLPGSLSTSGTMGDPQFFRYDGIGGATLQEVELVAPSPALRPGVVVAIEGSYAVSALGDELGEAIPVLPTHTAGDDVLIVVDSVSDLSLDPVDYDLAVVDLEVLAEPGDGTPVTLTHSDAEPANALYFFGEAGDVVRFQFDPAGVDFDILVFPPSVSAFIGEVCFHCAAGDIWVQLQETGFHFLNVINLDAADGEEYSVSFVRTHVTPQVIFAGVSIPGNLASADRGWYELDVSGDDWLTCRVAPASFSAALFDFYDRAAMGEIDRPTGGFIAGVPSLDADTSASGASFGRIYANDSSRFLVSVRDASGHDGDEVYSVEVAEQDYTDLGAVVVGSPIAATGETVAAAQTELYLAFAPPGSEVDVAISPAAGFDVVVDNLDRAQTALLTRDSGGAGGVESFTATVPAQGFVALAVRGAGGSGGTFDIDVSVVP